LIHHGFSRKHEMDNTTYLSNFDGSVSVTQLYAFIVSRNTIIYA